MEELAKLEAERGNLEYLETEGERISGGFRLKSSDRGGYEQPKRKVPGNLRQQDTADRNRHASNEMCIFLILNISSLQLIPVNMIAYRSQYGSVNPTAIIVPAIAATLVSTLVAIVYCKIKDYSARTGVRGSYMGGSADLVASEIRRMPGRNVGSGRAGTVEGILSKRREDGGGKAV